MPKRTTIEIDGSAVLQRIELPPNLDEHPIPPEMDRQIGRTLARIQAFQDRWDRPQIELFVAADYRYVYQALAWLLASQRLLGNGFLEWGCGFAAVTAMAAQSGLDAIGIEAEAELLAQARRTIADWSTEAELVQGNFLPAGAERFAEDRNLPSLGHAAPNAYEILGMDLDDFAIVYTYPWPGEADFHERVFDRYAAAGALLLVFYGPYDAGLWRKHV